MNPLAYAVTVDPHPMIVEQPELNHHLNKGESSYVKVRLKTGEREGRLTFRVGRLISQIQKDPYCWSSDLSIVVVLGEAQVISSRATE